MAGRHDDSFGTDTPGPGAYDVPEGLRGPGITIKGRLQEPSAQRDVPRRRWAPPLHHVRGRLAGACVEGMGMMVPMQLHKTRKETSKGRMTEWMAEMTKRGKRREGRRNGVGGDGEEAEGRFAWAQSS